MINKVSEKTRRVVWGVYSQDCYGMTDEQSDRYLLRTYEDYGKALTFAEGVSSRTAIHWKPVPLSHQCYDEQQSTSLYERLKGGETLHVLARRTDTRFSIKPVEWEGLVLGYSVLVDGQVQPGYDGLLLDPDTVKDWLNQVEEVQV